MVLNFVLLVSLGGRVHVADVLVEDIGVLEVGVILEVDGGIR